MTRTYPFLVSGDEFKGKRVLVTGGTKGMGQAMVRLFILSGASVATTACLQSDHIYCDRRMSTALRHRGRLLYQRGQRADCTDNYSSARAR
jgi:NAD(P)-dependent dehydrogenase (short-subunit alcohol dehydrogenase family)